MLFFGAVAAHLPGNGRNPSARRSAQASSGRLAISALLFVRIGHARLVSLMVTLTPASGALPPGRRELRPRDLRRGVTHPRDVDRSHRLGALGISLCLSVTPRSLVSRLFAVIMCEPTSTLIRV